MLPGFRFLFAAIVLSISILVFGLGAAALLRTAHEEFAANPTWRAAPEPVFAQQSETSKATSAMLRVNPPLPEPKPAMTTTAFAPIEPASPVSHQVDKAAAPAPDSPAPTEARPEIGADIKQDASTDTPPAQAAAPAEPAEAAPSQAPADTAVIKVATTEAPAPAETREVSPAATGETTPAATSDTAAPAKSEIAMAEASDTAAPAAAAPLQATASDPIAEKIASVGDMTAKGDETDAAKAAKAEQRARLRAARAKQRRRLAAERARLARQQAAAITPPFPLQQFQQQQQPTTDPFGQQQPPAITPRTIHAARAQ